MSDYERGYRDAAQRKGKSVLAYEVHIAELEAENERLREALDTLHAVVSLTPILGNKEALQEAFDLAGKALKGASDTPNVSYETPSVAEGG